MKYQKKKKKRFYRKKTATRRQGSLSKLSSKKIFGIDMGDTKQNEWVSTRDEKMMKLRVQNSWKTGMQMGKDNGGGGLK